MEEPVGKHNVARNLSTAKIYFL